jgi:uncharacterized membrane protein
MFSISEWMAPKVFMPSAIATLVFGILLVAVGKPAFDDFWVIIAMAGFLLTALLGGAYVGRLSKKIIAMLKSDKNDKRVDKLYKQVRFASRIDFALLLIIVFDMVAKPKITDLSFFIITIIFFALVTGFSWYRQYRAQ